MKKLLIKFVFLVLILLAIFSFVEGPLTKINPFQGFVSNFQQSVEEGCDYDLLFYGSSKSYSTFNPRILGELIAVNSFNFGNNGQRLPTTNFILEETLKDQNPQLVVVELYNQSMRSPLGKKNISFQFSSYDAFDFSLNKLRHSLKEFPLTELPFLYVKTLRNHKGWKSIESNKIDPQNTIYLKEENNGYRGWQYVVKNPEKYIPLKPVQREVEGVAYQLDEDQRKNLEELLHIAGKQKTKVLFVTAPSLRDLTNMEYAGYSKSLRDFLKERNHHYLDLNCEINNIGLDPYDFRDDIHLNHKGATKVSEYFGKWLNKHFDIGVLNTVEANVERYITEGAFSKSSKFVGRNLTDLVSLKRIDYIKTGNGKMSVIMELDLKEIEDLKKYSIMFHAHPKDKYLSFLSKNSMNKKRKYEIWDFKPEITLINDKYYMFKTIETKVEALKTINLGVYNAEGYSGLLYKNITISF